MLHRGTPRGPSISILHRKAIFGVDAEKDSGCKLSRFSLFKIFIIEPFVVFTRKEVLCSDEPVVK